MAGQRGAAADERVLNAERASPRRERRGQNMLREAVARKEAVFAEPRGGELARERREGRRMDRLGAAPGDAPPRQVEALEVRVLDAAHAQVVGKRRRKADGAAMARQR